MIPRTRSLMAVILGVALLIPAVNAAEDWPAVPPEEPPADWGPVGINFEDIDYPWPVHYLELNRFGEKMLMAYMDIQPTGRPNGQTIVWQHGHNVYAEAYVNTYAILAEAGFRVIAPDRIGYAKSSKAEVPYNFGFVASNMKALIDHLGLDEVAIVGHSMGGMVVSRFAMQYPDVVSHVVMVNQIGLTDQRQSRPWSDPWAGEPGVQSYQSILRSFQRYYPREWPPEQLMYVKRAYGQTLSGGYPHYARVRRLVGAMMYEDPVVYDWQHIATKALVMGGEQDLLADNFVMRATHVHNELQNSALLLYPEVGHNPHVEIPEQFHADLIRFLVSDPDEPASSWK
ncbi:MAG: alpha/beta hydrolase [Proteobacteria bacterium]|jgi:pimeloyl-ACP methyl ester carboxylesterase|nr:alpha/beta hydrolase [Pseudomonadota bacterium]MDA0926587.1 alpha/beta hydrolase [Pseudomonadota bacterium]